ncbi:SGNH/GDSL hydrolase family protein [Aquisphaera insulae]|uniref:SGNH/GDSL hydrolase family protein n=1 Tax=Aquisphaera insulae TaxID=2712864 RepID=UPI0013EC07AB|nr:SGNH/GDSL hydrolase family protein [Aquisphaera insulae]
MARLVRLAILGASIALLIVLVVAACHRLGDRISPRQSWQLRLAFLIGLEIVYSVLALTLLAAAAGFGAGVYRARKRRRQWQWLARGFLLASSLLFAFLVGEAVAAAWRPSSAAANRIPEASSSRMGSDQALTLERADEVRLPTTLPGPDPGAAAEIVILGESSAAGVPYDWWLSPGNMIAWQLEELMPGRRFHCTILAESGQTLAQQHRALTRLKRRPDVLIVFAGHNEFSARLAWSREVDHYLDAKVPSLWQRIVALGPRCSAVVRLIRDEADKCRIALPPPRGGYRNLIDVPAFTPGEYRAILGDFERRLEAIVAFAGRIGTLPILIAPAGNDLDYEPNRSYLPPETTASERAAIAREFLSIRSLEASDPEGARKRYEALVARQPGFAEAQHRLARLLEKAGEWEGAYQHALAARDLDGYPQRLPTEFQHAYRRVAARHGCSLIDAQSVFHAVGEHGLLDDHLFHDGLHPALRGQIALVQQVLQVIRDRSALGWPAGTPVPVIDPAAVAAHFRLTPWSWEKVCNFGIMFYDLTDGVRYDSSERAAKRDAFGKALEKIKAGGSPQSTGLPNIGVPPPVPIVPEAAIIPAAAVMGRTED